MLTVIPSTLCSGNTSIKHFLHGALVSSFYLLVNYQTALSLETDFCPSKQCVSIINMISKYQIFFHYLCFVLFYLKKKKHCPFNMHHVLGTYVCCTRFGQLFFSVDMT